MIKLCPIIDYNGKECTNVIRANGMCNTHYGRQKRGQDIYEPIKARRNPNMTNKEMIKFIVDNCEPAHNCLIWQGAKSYNINRNKPSPLISYKGKNMTPPRLLYQLTYGELDKYDVVVHKCGNPMCCEINHLFVGSSEDAACINLLSTDNAHRVLTLRDIDDIRASDEKHREIAKKYGVTKSTITHIKNDKHWKESNINNALRLTKEL